MFILSKRLSNNLMTLLKRKELIYNASESGIFPLPNQPIVLAKPAKPSSLNPFQVNYS